MKALASHTVVTLLNNIVINITYRKAFGYRFNYSLLLIQSTIHWTRKKIDRGAGRGKGGGAGRGEKRGSKGKIVGGEAKEQQVDENEQDSEEEQKDEKV